MPAASFRAPPDHACIKVVASFEALIATPFADGVNALCWPRPLEGDFGEIITALGLREETEIFTLEDENLIDLDLSPAGQIARDRLLADQRLLRDAGLAPTLDCIPAYPREAEPGPVPIDVYSFHADSAPIQADTYLCSYNEASSEGLRPADAICCIDVPERRAALLARYGGADDAGFAAYCREHFYDLHYDAVPGAEPYAFGLGNLWRITTSWPDSPVPPCVHRAPTTKPGQMPRLLLIS